MTPAICRATFWQHDRVWFFDYIAHTVGELQDMWRKRMDPIGPFGAYTGITYQIEAI